MFGFWMSWIVAHAAGPELIRSPQPQYPTHEVRDASIERRCAVDITLGLDGRPATIVPVDCDPEVADFTLKKLKRWRWTPPALSGIVVRVEIVYTPPSASAEYARPDYWRRNEAGECTAHIAIDPAGHAVISRVQEGCAVTVADVPPPPHPEKVAKRAPILCDLTFVAEAGLARDVERFRCPLWTWAWVSEVTAAWRWSQRTTRAEPWSVILELDARSLADPVAPPEAAAPAQNATDVAPE